MGSETENRSVWNSGTGAFFIVMDAFDRLIKFQIIKRRLFAVDWERFKLYASFVKSCCPFPLPSEDKLVDIDEGVFNALRIYKPNTPLLPNICILHWNPYEDTESYLDLFLSENLLEFLSLRANSAMLVSVKETCDRLRKLDIYVNRMGWLSLDDGSDSHLISSISNLVVHLPSLECIRSSVLLRDDAIVHLSTCPNLQTLRIPNDVTDFLRAYETNALHPMLSNLVSLHTFTHDPTSFVSLLRQCHLTKLQNLILNAEYMGGS